MDLLQKFDAGKENKTYQRVDIDYRVDCYVGYNEEGNMSMVITEFGAESPAKSSKLINVSMKRRTDKKLALTFDLLDGAYKSMFVMFCKDMIVSCEKAGSDMAISNALTRWKYWKELFGRQNNDILDKLAIKGLIGELLELRDYFMDNWCEADAISSWMGPLLGHKDFEIDNTWYEVKTVNENAVQVLISSLEQLESNTDGHLTVVRLEDTSLVNTGSVNLNSVVLSIINMINDPDALELFRRRLDNTGYDYNSEYDSICFTFKGVQRYTVNESFPRIRRDDIHQSIGNAKYTIMLDGIADFKEV